MFGDLFWVLFAGAVWLVAFIFVPKERISDLFPVGILAGFLLAFAIQLIGVTWLGLWAFNNPTLPVAGIPLLLPVAYIAEVIIFAHFLPVSAWGRIFYIIAFSLANALVIYFTVSANQQEFVFWSFIHSFVVGVISHLIAYYVTLAWRGEAKV